jgi:hypothetical protein
LTFYPEVPQFGVNETLQPESVGDHVLLAVIDCIQLKVARGLNFALALIDAPFRIANLD